MCDIDGDIETKKGLLIEQQIQVNQFGQIISDKTLEDEQNYFKVCSVYSCIGCSVTDILPLVGHERKTLLSLLMDEHFIPLNDEEDRRLKLIQSKRLPGVVLIKENDHLLAALIDQNNKTTVMGVIRTVLPHLDHNGEKQNVLMFDHDNDGPVYKVTNSKCLDLDSIIMNQTKSHLGVVSLGGYLVAALKQNDELILLLQHSYMVSIGYEIQWIRKTIESNIQKNGNKFQCKESTVREHEILICNRGALIVQSSNRLNLIGSPNAIVNYDPFRCCLNKL